jgi:hypothetical protein
MRRGDGAVMRSRYSLTANLCCISAADTLQKADKVLDYEESAI